TIASPTSIRRKRTSASRVAHERQASWGAEGSSPSPGLGRRTTLTASVLLCGGTPSCHSALPRRPALPARRLSLHPADAETSTSSATSIAARSLPEHQGEREVRQPHQ